MYAWKGISYSEELARTETLKHLSLWIRFFIIHAMCRAWIILVPHDLHNLH